MNRIDHALDHAQPLDGWTAWYVRQNPKLWEYYTKMLKLELELRFPATEPDNAPLVSANRQNYCTETQPNPQQNDRKNRRKNYLFGHRVWISAAGILFVLLTVLTLLSFSKRQEMDTGTPVELAQNQKIDLADVFDELSIAAAPLAELVPSIDNPFENPFDIPIKSSFEQSFERSLLELPLDPIVRFTDRPLESTLTILETAGIVRSSNHEHEPD